MVENQIRISVRNLVEFVLRSGSIDNRRSTKVQRDAMLTGSRLHRKIQKQMGSGYQAEVTLRHVVPLGELELILEGRADGILTEPVLATENSEEQPSDRISVTIDEIMVVFMDISKLEEPLAVHLAQAVCYGYIYALQNHLSSAVIQITYCQPDTEEIRRFSQLYSFARLEDEFNSYIREYGKWAQFIFHHRKERNQSLDGIQFPYSYRPGQRNLVIASYRTIQNGETLFLQAPTGIGKTLSVLFPSVVALGQGTADKIFYLTAKTITRSVAMEGLHILRETGAKLSFAAITAKEKLCLMETMDCNPLACPFAKGHFDRVNAAVYDLICQEEEVSREILLSYAQKYQVCPFEMSLDVTYWVDVIVCDYNYLYDPNVRLQRFFSDGEKGAYIFLNDEAHNLVERAREMYSAHLNKEEFLEAKKHYRELPAIVKRIESCNRKLLELKRECDTWRLLPEGEGMGAFVMALEQLYGELMTISDKYPGWISSKEASEFFFHVRDFMNVYEQLDENYRIYTEHGEDGKFWIHELCVNPAKRIRECCSQGTASIFFSATFLPIQYYKELIWGEEEVPAVYVRSPFDSSRRMIGIGADVSTRYSRRNKDEYLRYAVYVEAMLRAKEGNYMVFFPSYRYLQEIMAVVRIPDSYQIAVQETGMTEEDREQFLETFRQKAKPTVGFCVIGGIFSEGIDLQKEALIGVMIAGLGLAQVSPRQEILQRFYSEQGKDGYTFAYLYPGMNRVLQAAGRLIRTAEDYGIILLLDERFLRRDCREQFPVEWSDCRRLKASEAGRQIEEFWENLNRRLTDGQI
ncbi:MAG: ATP-dependent DNA helicase [Lachnospiraceae bacterium]|nr:ATP-dependent DNA helicase [Lachnospiraceae bacterium]